MTHKILKIAMLADLLVVSSYGLFLPLLPLFILIKIPNVDIQTIGITFAIYLLSKGIFGWLYLNYIDHNLSHYRAHGGIIVGSLIITVIPLTYLFTSSITQIFLIQITAGLGFGLIKPAMMFLHYELTKQEYKSTIKKIYHTTSIFCLAAMAALGGFIAYQYGFDVLFVIMTVLGSIGFLISCALPFEHRKKFNPIKHRAKKLL